MPSDAPPPPRSPRTRFALAALLALALGAALLALFALGSAPPASAEADPAPVESAPEAEAQAAAPDPAVPAPPACGFEDRAAPLAGYAQHAATPLDTLHALPADYAPPDLTSLREAGFADDRTVRALLIDDLRALREAAAAAGAPIEIQSAYRSYGYQARVFEGWVARLGLERALAVSARPGHSEHQLGTAVDVRSAGGRAPWELDDWAATPAGAWMAANAWRYGFVMSYPEGSESVTCYDYEPWHYRWIGREDARAVHEAGVPLRAWLWRSGGPLDGARDEESSGAP